MVPRRAVRSTVLLLGLALAGAALLRLAPSPLALRGTLTSVAGGTVAPDAGVVALLTGLGWVCLLWLVVAVTLSASAHVPGVLGRLAGGLAHRVAPAAVRRAVGATLGLSLAAGPLAGNVAHAEPRVPLESASPVLGNVGPFDRPVPRSSRTPEPRRTAVTAPHASATVVPSAVPAPAPIASGSGTGLTVVPGGGSFLVRPALTPSAPADRPATPAPATPAPTADPALLSGAGASAAADAGEVVVQRGDTLWGLASAQLGAAASPAAVDAQWRRWYAANRVVIGDDPDLIRPGQRLQAPAMTSATTPRSPR